MGERPSSYEYLRALEAKERSRRRWRWVAAALAVGTTCSVAWMAPQFAGEPPAQPVPFRRVSGEYLTRAQVRSLFMKANSPVLLTYPGKAEGDTLYRYEDFLDIYPPGPANPDAPSTILAVETRMDASPVRGEKPDAPVFGFKVLGKAMAGHQLTFQVLNYDPSAKFEFNFGNGQRRETGKMEQHTYDAPGIYRVDLWVTETGQDPELYATAMVEVEEEVAGPTPADTREAGQALAAALPLDQAGVMPVFPGGKAAMYTFIQRNLRYPRTEEGSRKEGQVHVGFVVDEEGRLTSPQILQSMGSAYDDEVLRILRLMPSWEPGEQNGHPVAVQYQLRVNFDWTP